MSRSFNGSAHLLAAFSAITANPYTLFVRAFSTSAATTTTALNYTRSAITNGGIIIEMCGTVAGDPIRHYRSGVASSNADQGSYLANTYAALTARSRATNDADISLDTATTTNATTAAFPSAPDLIDIGCFVASGSRFEFLVGDACQVAAWDVALNDSEVASLARGFSPRRIRPQSLKFYAPLLRDLFDFKGRAVMTNFGSSASTSHARTYGF